MSENEPPRNEGLGNDSSPMGAGSSEILDGKTIWHNPPEIGHFAIKIRKQMYEYWLVEQLDKGLTWEEIAVEREKLFEQTNYLSQNLGYLHSPKEGDGKGSNDPAAPTP